MPPTGRVLHQAQRTCLLKVIEHWVGLDDVNFRVANEPELHHIVVRVWQHSVSGERKQINIIFSYEPVIRNDQLLMNRIADRAARQWQIALERGSNGT